LLQRGTIVAGYRVDGVLGEGGMAVVYRATQLSLNRTVALKLLASELSEDPGFRERFRREGQLQAAIDHLHIVPVYEAGQTEVGLFLAMRLIEGSTLKDLILAGGLDPRRSLRLLAQVAQALDAAHEAGLIHRDVKPQNILIGEGDHVYLADFGLIKAPDEARLTGTGQFMGTIDYVAPEQIQGEPATAASDTYALTAVLCECLTNQVPFARPNEVATLHAHVTAPPPRLTEQNPELPPALDEVIASGMAKDPAQRPTSASELIQAAARAFATAGSRPGVQETRLSRPPTGASEDSQITRGYRLTVPVAPDVSSLAADPTVLPKPPAEPTVASALGVAEPPVTERPARERPGVAAAAPKAALLAALAIAVIAGGFLVGHSGGRTAAAQFRNFATVGHLQLRYPSGWQLSSVVPRVPGISFSDRLMLATNGAAAGLTAGEVLDAGGPTLLPASFRSQLQAGSPAPEPVLLGDLQAYRYTGLSVRGLGGTLSLYAVPTSAGVATITCWASTPTPHGFKDQCARVAATLRLVGATPFALGPSAAYARRLSSTFDQLRIAVAKPARLLTAAGTPSGQAGAAQDLAQAYQQAATKLSRATASPLVREANDAVVAALGELAQGYSRAAGAARSGNDGAYRRAIQEVGRGSTTLSAATGALAGLGYKVAA
jgi:Protein kinase domain